LTAATHTILQPAANASVLLRDADTHTLRIPRIYYYGSLSSNPGGGTSIIMEHLDFSSGSDQGALGTQLARMHLAELKVLLWPLALEKLLTRWLPNQTQPT
jgi:fructosamine-3-kinase